MENFEVETAKEKAKKKHELNQVIDFDEKAEIKKWQQKKKLLKQQAVERQKKIFGLDQRHERIVDQMKRRLEQGRDL